VKAAHIQQQQPGMFYPKTQSTDKQGWKSGSQNGWPSYPGSKPVLPNMSMNMVSQNYNQKERDWKDSRITSSQYPQHQQQPHVPFATSGFRQQSLNSMPRPGSMGSAGRPVMQQQHHHHQQQPPQQEANWQVGPGGWGTSLNFHAAARKFGRRRGNARSNTLIYPCNHFPCPLSHNVVPYFVPSLLFHVLIALPDSIEFREIAFFHWHRS
jgi:hypothetical protein